ncbi:hypothetical protein HanXRQr2_Chr07g0312281 [Helianthus annuus]|uniref:Uncharacterized protein n=1 Tax=Helianthus annuus TaxID=4232 RepID=A0A9K3IP15_HELAN|nr:hypothetical protein HanXRQr2_Chr07g0312281 [Helianthus annuus]KAJ0558532.1 hypothetical protein HanIR_Chr07g0337341 [Helianthus annuus]
MIILYFYLLFSIILKLDYSILLSIIFNNLEIIRVTLWGCVRYLFWFNRTTNRKK